MVHAGDDRMYQVARRLVDCGLSVIPIKPDGSKAPALSTWKPFQEEKANDVQLRTWFTGRSTGIAVVGGQVSGNLEALDFDERGLLEEYLDMAADQGFGALVDRLPIVETPSGGRHLYWRSMAAVPGNLKLAWGKTDSGEKRIRIETRGEGGYALIPPTPPRCHPDNKPYTYLRNDLALVPTIEEEERESLLALARLFNEWVEPERVVKDPRPHHHGDGLRPGDDFNARGAEDPANGWAALLRAHSLEHKRTRGEAEYWGWIGNGRAICASLNLGGAGLFYNFSSNAYPFEADRAYSLFSAYAILRHNGDYGAAARQLGLEGYGDPPRRPVPSDSEAPPGARAEGSAIEGSAITGGKGTPRCTDYGNARRLVERHGADVRFCHAWGQWLIWDGRRWAPDETGEIMRRAFSTVATIYQEAAAEPEESLRKVIASWAIKSESSAKLTSMVNVARDQLEIPIRVNALDADPFLLTCLNGTLDLRTGKLLPHSRGHLITKLAPIYYDDRAACPLWDRFLLRTLDGDETLIAFVRRAIGYALTGDMRRHGFFILHGKGRNGKSTFIETIRAVMGDYALETPAESLMAKKNDSNASNDIARLRGARFVSAGESDEGHRLAENLIKRLSGGDTMTARFLHQEFFEFKPQFKLFLATNHKPIIRGTDEGIWRRVNLIPFDVQIPYAEVDELLGEKLRRELPGILAWAVRGCLEWQQGGLEQPAAVKAATQDYRTEMDTLGAFLEQKCEEGTKERAQATELYKAYASWCEEWGEHQMTQTTFGRRLADRGFKTDKTGGVIYRCGLRLLKSWETEQGGENRAN